MFLFESERFTNWVFGTIVALSFVCIAYGIKTVLL